MNHSQKKQQNFISKMSFKPGLSKQFLYVLLLPQIPLQTKMTKSQNPIEIKTKEQRKIVRIFRI